MRIYFASEDRRRELGLATRYAELPSAQFHAPLLGAMAICCASTAWVVLRSHGTKEVEA